MSNYTANLNENHYDGALSHVEPTARLVSASYSALGKVLTTTYAGALSKKKSPTLRLQEFLA